MNKNKITLLMLVVVLFLTACASGNRAGGKNCGCPSKKGMVGY